LFIECRDVAQLGSALVWGISGRRFKSCHPDQFNLSKVTPEILETTKNCLQQARKTSGKEFVQVEINPEHFKDVPDDSIDYAVMEKTRNVAVVACDIGWSDIGCWLLWVI
jgi:mannose-1-phosphate guanylyltransferase